MCAVHMCDSGSQPITCNSSSKGSSTPPPQPYRHRHASGAQIYKQLKHLYTLGREERRKGGREGGTEAGRQEERQASRLGVCVCDGLEYLLPSQPRLLTTR